MVSVSDVFLYQVGFEFQDTQIAASASSMGTQQQHSDVSKLFIRDQQMQFGKIDLSRKNKSFLFLRHDICAPRGKHPRSVSGRSNGRNNSISLRSSTPPPTGALPMTCWEVDDPGFSLVIASSSHPVAVCRI